MNKKINKLVPKIKNIKILVCDVDGVLTKGDIILNEDGKEIKVFNVKDGLAINLARENGLKIVWLSGRKSLAVSKRAAKLKIDLLQQEVKHKKLQIQNIAQKFNCNLEEIAFIGDDLNDLGLINKVGIFFAVLNANPEIKKNADFILKNKGGEGAVAEAIYLILKIQNKYQKIITNLKQ